MAPTAPTCLGKGKREVTRWASRPDPTHPEHLPSRPTGAAGTPRGLLEEVTHAVLQLREGWGLSPSGSPAPFPEAATKDDAASVRFLVEAPECPPLSCPGSGTTGPVLPAPWGWIRPGQGGGTCCQPGGVGALLGPGTPACNSRNGGKGVGTPRSHGCHSEE